MSGDWSRCQVCGALFEILPAGGYGCPNEWKWDNPTKEGTSPTDPPAAARECPQLDTCPKVAMILDKDLAGDWQYAEIIRATCKACREREVDGPPILPIRIAPGPREGDPDKKQPYVCPVCGGKRYLPPGFYGPDDVSPDPHYPERCRSCEGTGVVWR